MCINLRKSAAMGAQNVVFVSILTLLVAQHLWGLAFAQGSSSTWLTIDGNAPLVIARGGFSGFFPDSSLDAYNLAMVTSVPDVVLWCDVQLTKDGVGICFPDIKLDSSSDISGLYPKRESKYNVNGVETEAYFPIDFTLKELGQLSLTQGINSRSPAFDYTMNIPTVDDVFTQNKPEGFWLNIQHDAFYTEHKLSMRSFVISALKSVIVSHISSPEVNFLKSIARPLASTKTKSIFRFLDTDVSEPTTNQTYGSLLKNLTYIKTFASGILVPKSYIWPVDATLYLQPHTSLVADAHKAGLQVYAANFGNDLIYAYNYSNNPVSEYLSFIDNGEFSVDGVVSDFPITPSEARDCFAHLGKNASAKAIPLVISHCGASGDYPACTDLSYTNAISFGADFIDCPVQISKDGVPFCSSSINLLNGTQVGQSQFRDQLQTINEIQPNAGIFSFSLDWADIQSLTPMMISPYSDAGLYRNPKFKTAGKLISLSKFLDLAKNATLLSGVVIKIENAKYLATKEGLSVTDAVSDALDKAGYNAPTAKKVMIQSTNSSVLKAMKGKSYELVYEVDETIRDALNATVESIKTFAGSVVVNKESVFPRNGGFLFIMNDIVARIKSFKLPVYVQLFENECVTQAYDFFSDPIVEINSFVIEGGIDGVITAFPQTAVAYKKNLCLKMKNTPIYMSPVQPGSFIRLTNPMPPAEAPNPLLTVADVAEAPLPPAVKSNVTAPAPSAPKSPNAQHQVTASLVLSCLIIMTVSVLML